MAVRESVPAHGAVAKRTWFVVACLVVLFVAALFLRAYWNLDAANPSPGEFVLSGGSDPYYHKHAVDRIQASGFQHEATISDPLLNYPRGAENPNPPLFEWVIAVSGKVLEGFFSPATTPGGVALSALEVATWHTTLWTPAIFGALTLFPIYFIGAALFDRRAGLVAALLWTVATSAVDSGGVGLADHDSTVLFFVTLAFLFYIQMLRQFRGDSHWVTKWSDGGAVSSGLARLLRERRAGFAYALLAAFSIAAVGLTWKGFNYVIGIVFLYATLQMVLDHWRSKDSTGLFLGTLVALGVGVLAAYPYYTAANVGNFLQPTWYLLAAFVAAGIVLVPTRDLPTILVFPLAAAAGLVLAGVAFFVFPEVSQSLLYATVYFKQTRLYETIAEAHPADFATIAFGVGPLPFFLAIAGWFYLLYTAGTDRSRAWIYTAGFGIAIAAVLILSALSGLILRSVGANGAIEPVGTVLNAILAALAVVWFGTLVGAGASGERRAVAFALVWAAVAVFMAQSAVRFLSNAIPVFCVFAGYFTIWVLDWLDFAAIKKSLAANRGNTWQGLKRGVRPLHGVAVVLIGLLFVFPATMLAADAALPPEAEQRLAGEAGSEFGQRFFSERMGAYGQSFGQVKPWIGAFEFLRKHDANISDPVARPAFLSWWDYGHWAVSIGDHPTVADNFQNGYEFAANFILSQNEAHGIQLLAARLAEDPRSDLEAALRETGSSDPAAHATLIRNWQEAPLDVAQSAALLAKVEEQTGKKIRYFAADIRMLPYDSASLSPDFVDAGSIFYAPVTLKGDKPDDYVTTQVSVADQQGRTPPGTTGYVTVDEYRDWARDPIRQYGSQGQRLVYQDKFFNSAYWRHYVGPAVEATSPEPILGEQLNQPLGLPRPAHGLEHFRAVYVGQVTLLFRGLPDRPETAVFYPDLVVTEYYPGAVVEGTVLEGGVGQAGVTVTAYDDVGRLLKERYGDGIRDPEAFNVPHQSVTTDADGKFRLLAPFALEGGNVTIVAERGGAVLGSAALPITREQANGAPCAECSGVTITVARGSVNGTAFRDLDGNGIRNMTEGSGEDPVEGVTIRVGGVPGVTGADGAYSIADVPVGVQGVTVDDSTLVVAGLTSRVNVRANDATHHNVGLQEAPAQIAGTIVADTDNDGTPDPVAGVAVSFEPDPDTPDNTADAVSGITTSTEGAFNARLRAGTYVVTATYTPEGSTDTYNVREVITVGAGETITDRTLTLTRAP